MVGAEISEKVRGALTIFAGDVPIIANILTDFKTHGMIKLTYFND